MKIKAVLYCVKQPPYLYHDEDYCFDTMNTIDLGYKTFKFTNQRIYDDETGKFLGWETYGNMFKDNSLNGKIIAECDYDLDKVEYKHIKERDKIGILHNEAWYEYKGLNVSHYECDLASRSGFDDSHSLFDYLFEYLSNKEGYPQDGYAVHLNNVNIFNKTRELSQYLLTRITRGLTYGFYNTSEIENERVIVIAVSPQEACNILNGKQDTIIRRNVLKEMLE